MRKLCFIFGTRPEAIKMAPVVAAARSLGANFVSQVWVTGQHRQMLDQVLALFEIKPDYDFNTMRPGQTLSEVTCSILEKLGPAFERERPDLVLVHGDTTTSMTASLAAFYHRIPVAHVEAGLRTRHKYSPYPEEINRRITGVIADLHFAPTPRARANLLAENVPPESIHVTGNTVVDALFSIVQRIKASSDILPKLNERFAFLDPRKRLVLVTGHRRENFGRGFEQICTALTRIVAAHPEVELIYPVHLNPHVRGPVLEILGNKERIHLIEPIDYLPFVYLLQRCSFVITDSGGIQEEAPALGKPVLVMRDTTERPEAVEAGTVKLVGTDQDVIFEQASRLLSCEDTYEAMCRSHNPYGDGHAAKRIVEVIEKAAILEA